MTTTNHLLFALKLFSALGCGLVAGVFFAFSAALVPPLGSADYLPLRASRRASD